MPTQEVRQGRARFPRGLTQPEQGYRFAADSLLLACYPRPREGDRFLELGTGCGAVSLGLLLSCGVSGLRGVGLDRDPEMVRAAEANAALLGFTESFRPEELDVRSVRQSRLIRPESFDLVLVNPPYRRPEQGRQSPVEAENAARVELGAGLEDFLRAAAYALKNKGLLEIVFLADRLPYLMGALAASRLEPKRMRSVHGRRERKASQVLVEARKNGGEGLAVEPPLILYSGEEGGLSQEALRFCPFLECNRRRESGDG
ncbi:MAG: methyltransferase domain-containing protein [Desulfohalobiaceae bacterium]|nr:methyltransferase domain-containing protein [Desulfohalobiaceae bacterium]